MNESLKAVHGNCRMVDGHWLWAGATSVGVPRIWGPDYTRHDGAKRSQPGRRAVWHIKTGKPIPEGWRVFGTCNEPSCLNPDHMVCRSVAVHGRVVAKSGRLKGSMRRIIANRALARKRTHLTAEMVELIQQSNKTGRDMAKEIGVSYRTISKVRQGKHTAFKPVGGLFSGLL